MKKYLLFLLIILAAGAIASCDLGSSDDSSDSSSTEGAFKIVNSWGAGVFDWENISDGHYWIEYEDMKTNGMYVWYFINDYDSDAYDPSAIAVFEVDHAVRDDVQITIGLRDNSDTTIMSKTFETDDVDGIPTGGALPFPDNPMVLDLGEFVDYLNDYDLFLTATNLGTTEGTIESFSLELYNGYDSSGVYDYIYSYDGSEILAGSTITMGSDGTDYSTVTMEIETSGNIDSNWTGSSSISSTSSFVLSGGTSFTTRQMTSSEISDLVSKDSQNNPNAHNPDGLGTGWLAPTTEEWEKTSLLTGIENISSKSSSSSDDEVDLSATDYFPPIGNQGTEGSCVAFSTAYYMHTYMEAREHGWDLSDISWDDEATTISDYGEPDSGQDMIFSPDYIYHQTNYGEDGGSAYIYAVETIVRQGCATWEAMPYNTEDSTTWPDEEAWRNAAQYRVDFETHYDGESDYLMGFLVVDTDEEIEFLEYLLSEGYPLCTAIDGGSTTDYGLYDYLDENDVVENGYTFTVDDLNHAQTIVGYKANDEWDSSNPED
ncbi:MAG: hypothetical protein PQJ59_19005 [Spirochaetales bacterium]|nr:hypothetical protein [Spirochaetales bacterium]